MKTPDDTKRALVTCTELVMPKEVQHQAMLDALAYIQQLERERDAAVKVVKATPYSCEYCKHHESGGCDSTPLPYAECFEWRGVKEE